MKYPKAFAPANISLLFKALKRGSLGVGFTVNKGVDAHIVPSKKTAIYFNGKKITFPTVESVLDNPYKVFLHSDLPLGSGFGLSGASAFATALLVYNKSRLACAKIAHNADVDNKTGLGDVANQYFGGLCIKFVSSAKFQVKKIPIPTTPVYCYSFGKLITSGVLSNATLLEKINTAADKALQGIRTNHTFSQILTIAKQYAIDSGLLTSHRVRSLINAIENQGGHATMIMLGEGVVSDIPFPGAITLHISSMHAKRL